MAEPLCCPKCRALLTDAEVIRLHRQYAAAQRKTKSGGHNGGRPPRYADRIVSGFRCPNGCALNARSYRFGDQCITCLALLVRADAPERRYPNKAYVEYDPRQ